ncbi:hypothetical protein [Planktothrix paucivesiculata]|uniref:hypothetical protein n=1 Tax=Planktothrix paucivesiculata TaxID=1678308 RepID=UPI0009F98722|nr:hypothetical protein [Planktothrix paucivesiculata]
MNFLDIRLLDNEDLVYIAALIQHIKKNPNSKSSRFSKNLILITIGAVSIDCFEDSGKLTFSSGYDDLLEDFIENFMQLYPHYFENNNPVFSLVVCSIIDLGL